MALEDNVIDWQPGQLGRGLITTDGAVHVWDRDESDHTAYKLEHGLYADQYFYVESDGRVLGAMLAHLPPYAVEIIEEADPHFYYVSSGGGTWE